MTSQDSTGLDSRTRALAYELWKQAGKPDGQGLEFWERARQIITSEAATDGLAETQPDVLTD